MALESGKYYVMCEWIRLYIIKTTIDTNDSVTKMKFVLSMTADVLVFSKFESAGTDDTGVGRGVAECVSSVSASMHWQGKPAEKSMEPEPRERTECATKELASGAPTGPLEDDSAQIIFCTPIVNS